MQRKLLKGIVSGTIIPVVLLAYFLIPDVDFSGEEFNSNDYVGIAPTPEPVPDDLLPNETVTEYRKIQGGNIIQEEWEIERVIEPRPLIAFGTLPAIGLENVALILLTVQPNLINQLTIWRDECDLELADSGIGGYAHPAPSNPNNDPQAAYDGLSEVEWCTAQSEMLDYVIVNNGLVINTDDIFNQTDWITAFTVMRDDYEEGAEYTYDAGGTVISRADIEASFTVILQTVGAEALVSIESETQQYTKVVSRCLNGCTQILTPISDQGNVGFTENDGDGDGSAFDELDEGLLSMAGGDDWVSTTNPDAINTQCVTAGADSDLIMNMSTGNTDPIIHTGHVTAAGGNKSSSGGRQIDIVNIFCQSNTVIGTGTNTDISNIRNDYISTITAGEAANITNYDILDNFIGCDTIGGGPGRTCLIGVSEMTFPDETLTGRRIFIVD